MASLSSKQRSCVILVAWKFLSVLLICKNLGSLLKAVDLHINDISVTEKEGAAAHCHPLRGQGVTEQPPRSSHQFQRASKEKDSPCPAVMEKLGQSV